MEIRGIRIYFSVKIRTTFVYNEQRRAWMKLVTFLAEGKVLVGVRSEDGRYYYPISALGLN